MAKKKAGGRSGRKDQRQAAPGKVRAAGKKGKTVSKPTLTGGARRKPKPPRSLPAPSVAAKKKPDGGRKAGHDQTGGAKRANRKAAPGKASEGKRAIEQYAHADKQRANNPPVGLVNAATDPVETPKKTYQYDPHLDPQLVWAGKAERTSFDVPSVSLHVHERIDPKTIIAAVRTNGERATPIKPRAARQMSLFEAPDENPPLRDALDFYKHPHGWTNRLVAGDSLLVMNSLLEKEGMAGKVQMIYIDPPYGIRYGSNFQPFVNRRDVKDGKDDDLSREPETIKAFRDTWELGIHSYLTYMRDRLRLSRELLSVGGSLFVQISDESLHYVRNLLDDSFGADCLVVVIPVKKKGSQKSQLLDPVNDYVVWYTKTPRSVSDGNGIKFHALFQRRALDSDAVQEFKYVEMPDGAEFTIDAVTLSDGSTRDYRHAPDELLRDVPGVRLFRRNPMKSGGHRANQSLPYELNGKVYTPGAGNCWKTRVRTEDGTTPGMDRLKFANRLLPGRSDIRFRSYYDDFGYVPVSNWWDNLGGASSPVYVVQTNTEIVKRCVLMTTDPGDLVFDPTCGSGTTAYVAEQWGRRWITCDTSRVAVTLAKQRLMTAVYDYYQISKPDEGICSGFVCETVPHVTLKDIANNADVKEGMSRQEIDEAIKRHAKPEPLYDRPIPDKTKARVTGPFTVEAVPAIDVRPLEEVTVSKPMILDPQATLPGLPGRAQPQLEMTADASISRYGETARQRQWRDELQASGVRGKGGQKLLLAWLEPCPAARWLHALGETKDIPPKPVAVSFGPEFAPLEQRQVQEALSEAQQLHPRPAILLFAAFQFDPEAAKDIDEINPKLARMTPLRVQMNTDLLTDDLKKKRASNESFWLMGQPDTELRRVKDPGGVELWQVELHGFDYYNPLTGEIESGGTSRIALWLLDPDYDGRSLFPRQVFFPMAGEKDGWARLAKNLKAEIDEELIEAYRGTVSLPFAGGKHQRAAVKIVDDRGIESLKIIPLGEGSGR